MTTKQSQIDPTVVKKWENVIDGKGKWKEFVESECPRIDRKFKPIMAQMLENCAAEVIGESTQSAAVGDYKPILIPLLRRTIPSQIGPRILGTWAMTAPAQQIIAIRAVYQNDTVNPIDRSNSKILVLADATAFTVGGDIAGSAGGVGVIRAKSDNYVLVEVSSGSFTVGDDVDNANPYVASDTTISAVVENEALFQYIFKDYAGPYSTSAGEALTTDMKEMGFKIDTTTINAESYKLKAKWTNELEEDMKAIHGLEAEQWLAQIATDEINLEINQKIIDRVDANVGNTVAFDYSTADGTYELQKYQNLMAAISRQKRQIAVTTKRGQATWMIVSPAVLAAIEHAGKLDSTNADPANNVYMGKALGMDVFCDIYATSDDILLGYKGNTEADAGIFMGMYKPITAMKGYGEEDGQPRSFFRTRIGFEDTLLGTGNYFRKITVANLPTA